VKAVMEAAVRGARLATTVMLMVSDYTIAPYLPWSDE